MQSSGSDETMTLAEEVMPSSREPSDLLKGFEDLGTLGIGGTSLVRRVFELALNREVAMKRLRPELCDDPDGRRRFLREAQVMGRLEHPQIVPVHALGVDRDDDTPYFTMRLVRGTTLGQFYSQKRKSGDKEALLDVLEILVRVCEALAYAHDRGVIHCDLKPQNIMVGPFGQTYIIDWGAARILESEHDPGASPDSAVMGTFGFMAPEQAEGRATDLDERTDIFCLGGVLYYILTGRPPYKGAHDLDVLSQAIECQPLPPERVAEAPPALLSRIAMRALRKDPKTRYPSALALADDLKIALRGGWRFPIVEYAAGATILREGESGSSAFMVKSGQCEVFNLRDGHKVVHRTVGPGDVFGETAVITGRARSANVTALGPVSLLVIDASVFHEELGLSSPLWRFIRAVGDRFLDRSEETTRLHGELHRSQAREALVRLLNDQGELAPDGSRSLPWSQVLMHLAVDPDSGEDQRSDGPSSGLPREGYLESPIPHSAMRWTEATLREVTSTCDYLQLEQGVLRWVERDWGQEALPQST